MRTCTLVFALACGAHSSGGDPEPATQTCRPAGLESATAIQPLQLPPGCQLRSTGSVQAPQTIDSADQLATFVSCAGAVEFEFASHSLRTFSYGMSPAHGGAEILDDGETVTFAIQQRSPCPDDPRPMPMDATLAYPLPRGAVRQFAQAVCTLPPQCD